MIGELGQLSLCFALALASAAVAVNQNRRGCVGVAVLRTHSWMNDLEGLGHVLAGIRGDFQMWKIGLGGAGGCRVVVGDGDDLNISFGEVVVMRFELTELDHADRSPPAAEEDQRRALASLEILLGK